MTTPADAACGPGPIPIMVMVLDVSLIFGG